MDELTKLFLARYQVKNIMELIKDNPYEQYMYMHLNTVYYEIEQCPVVDDYKWTSLHH